MADIRFSPALGTDEQIQRAPKKEGRVYFATDTRKIYLDTDVENKLPVGGAGNSGIYYGTKELTDEEKELEEIQFTLLNDIEGEELPSQNDLVLNIDGCFYRVILVDIKNKIVTGSRLTVAGSGGGVSSIIRPSLTLHDIETPIIVNGQSFEIYFTAKSALDENNIPFNQNLTINWSLIDADTKQIYYTGIPKTAVHDEITSLNVGEYLKPSASTIIQLQASGNNHDQASVIRQVEITSVEMYLKQISSYNPAIIYNSENVVLNCNAIGRLSKILEWSVDGQVLHSEVLSLNSANQQSFTIPKQFADHGHHAIEVNLYQNLGSTENPIKGLSATPLKYEIAVKEEGNKKPIIWLGEYKDNYYNYEVIQIPFLVYDPTNLSEVKVRLYKNDIEIDGSPRTIKDFSAFNYWQIADAVENKTNYYSIACGSTTEMTVKREIEFTISESSMKIKSENLKLNFDPAGRSNSEPEAKRKSWTYEKNGEKISANFEKFNWNNNGWLTDKDTKNTFLRISNGAKFTIPFNELEFEGSTDETDMHSLELVFKIRNIQDYSNLITNITRYDNDEEYYKEFKEQNIYNNYDALLFYHNKMNVPSMLFAYHVCVTTKNIGLL